MVDYLNDAMDESATPPPGVLLADHFIESYGYYGYRAHGTKDWLLTYTINGGGLFRVNKLVQPAEAGDVVIFTPGIPQHYAPAPGQTWDFMWAHFLPLPEWHKWLQLPKTEEDLIYLSISDVAIRQRIQDAFKKLIRDINSDNLFQEDLAMLDLAEILVLLRQQYTKSISTSIDERVEEILDYLAGHLSEPVRLSDLARKGGMSESRMCHLFKEETGNSIIDTLLKMRLNKGAKLLELTNRQIAEISSVTGFQSPFYFTRKFTSHYGISPSAFRKETQKKWNMTKE